MTTDVAKEVSVSLETVCDEETTGGSSNCDVPDPNDPMLGSGIADKDDNDAMMNTKNLILLQNGFDSTHKYEFYS